MTPADQARESAIHCEMKKYALRQSKEGIIVSFVLHPHEVPQALQTADIGSRWMVALVEINDDESPKEVMPNPPTIQSSQLDARPQSKPHSAGARWRDLQPAAQAGIRCEDPIFKAFLADQYAGTWKEFKADAPDVVRYICAVNSRSELSHNHKARVLWHQLDEQFLAWKALEHA